MLTYLKISLAILTLFVNSALAFSHDYKKGDLFIDHPVIRAPIGNAKVTAGYMKVTNNGNNADRLVAISAKFAGKSEIHTMEMDGDVMKMRPLSDGIVIEPGQTVELKPGGLHLMFMRLNTKLQLEQRLPVILQFEKAGEIEVELIVTDAKKLKPAKHKHGEHDHSHSH